MREIKFRIRLKNKETGLPLTMVNEIFDLKNGAAFFDINLKEWEFIGADQFTGLTDKAGKEIYEGDIVKFSDLMGSDKIGFIKFREGSFRISSKMKALKEWDGEIRMWNDGSHDWYSIENLESFEIEVIGNIHEHPDLLK